MSPLSLITPSVGGTQLYDLRGWTQVYDLRPTVEGLSCTTSWRDSTVRPPHRHAHEYVDHESYDIGKDEHEAGAEVLAVGVLTSPLCCAPDLTSEESFGDSCHAQRPTPMASTALSWQCRPGPNG